jgi:MFS family permease
LFVNDPNATTIVPLVQTATTLPMMLLALPAGVLADAFDRRWMMLAVQIYVMVIAVLLAVLTALGMMPPALLLACVFAAGAGMAMTSPTWQSLITELVPRTEIPAATRLDMVSVNVSRAAGPAFAGFIIATWGVPPVFALNAALTGVLAVVLLVWRRPTVTRADRERFVPALRAGGRYVRHTPIIRTLLLRFVTFVLPAGIIWALLPLIASRQLSAGPSGYGILFSSLGVGAVVGALGLGMIKRHLTSNTVLALAAAVFGAAFVCLAFTSSVLVAIPLLVICGFGWSSTVATVTAEMQLFLPGWVRARGLGILLMVFLGTQAVTAPVWGLAAGQFGLRITLLIAAGLLALSAATVGVLRIPDGENLDRSPLAYWDTPRISHDPDPTSPVVVSVEYTVAATSQADFLIAMQALRGSRLRSGAVRWNLYRIGEDPQVFVEQFEVASWQEHQRQHEGRLTAEDQAIEDVAFAHVTGPPRPRHLLLADSWPATRIRDHTI